MRVSKSSLIKPQRLKPGDTLAIISPAGPTPVLSEKGAKDPFETGIALLEAEGFQVRLMPHARAKSAYLAGSDEERLADLHQAFDDPDIQGILCARGGYGCMRLLSWLDFEKIRRNPKVFVGFSDITALLVPFYQQAGLIGFYGPMLTSNLIHGEPFSQKELLETVQGHRKIPDIIQNLDTYTCFHFGTAEGPLIGGNLSLLTALCGTPYQPQTAGHLLFIEDWTEKYYSLDRQFQQLKLAGLFERIQGLILCDFSEIEPEPEYDLTELLRRLTSDLNIPVGFGFSVGHGNQTATLPIGVQARFEADSGILTLLESPVL